MKKNGFDNKRLKNVGELLELAAAYQKSQILYSFAEFEIADLLDGKKMSSAEIADKLKLDKIAAEKFLNAAVSVGLLTKKNSRYTNSDLTDSFLVKSREFYLGGQIERHRSSGVPEWTKLTERLKKWTFGDEGKGVPEDDDQGADAMTDQHNLALLHGYALGKSFDFSKYKKVLDLGGATGATSIALCRSYPNLQSVVFDLPENIKVAEKIIVKENLKKRISLVAGDFKKDNLPDDFDIVLLANLMSVADAEQNKSLLKKLYKKLPSGGACIISGWILDMAKLSPQLSVLFCLEDICRDAPDVERSEKAYADWLKKAGFKSIKCETYLEPTKFLTGTKK